MNNAWGYKHKANAMAFILQKGRAGVHIFQDPAFAFHTQVHVDAAGFGNPLHQGSGFVGVQLIGDKNPLPFRVGGDGLLHVGDKVRFRSGVLNGRGNHLAGRHLKVGNQRLRAVAPVFVLDSFRLPGLHGLCRVNALQGLHAGFFIDADHVNALSMQRRRLLIQVADGFDVGLEGRFISDCGV